MLLKLIFIHPSDTLDNTRRTKTYNQLTKFFKLFYLYLTPVRSKN
jgi:hypothetical protein